MSDREYRPTPVEMDLPPGILYRGTSERLTYRDAEGRDWDVQDAEALVARIAALEERNEALERAARDFLDASPMAQPWPSYQALSRLLSTHQGQGTEEASSEFSVRPTSTHQGQEAP